jgi:hypothetical protein
MINSQNLPLKSTFETHSKDTKFQSETKIFFDYLQSHTATCSMVSEATGIKQKNLCRYKVELQRAHLLWEIDYRPCKITGFKAQWLTTNADIIPAIDKAQLSLFEIGGKNE